MNKKETGQMCIFLGYAAGVGKTYAMLEAAHDLKKSGVDVVAGYIEPHERAETRSKEEGLEKIPPLLVDYKGIKLREVDLNGILKRNPEVVLIDELAHTNAPGMCHQKRYEDIEEILNAGIDVYTTVNIQHLESLNDIVGKISGIHVKERIPDFIFDRATQIKLIDIEPDVLIQRLKDGKIYKSTQAERALHNFFAKEKLIALREITLRRTADKVNREAAKGQQAVSGDEKREIYQGEHILVCISPVVTTTDDLTFMYNDTADGDFTQGIGFFRLLQSFLHIFFFHTFDYCHGICSLSGACTVRFILPWKTFSKKSHYIS